MRLRLLTASVLLSLVSLGAAPGLDPAAAGETDRRFKGSGEGVVTEYVSPVNWIIDYTGNATHLGKFTRREDVTFDFGAFTFTGTIVFVAADGDELWTDFSGHFTGPNSVEATYTFTGGTGRFTDATGTATAVATTPDFVHVSVTFDGTIDY